MTTSDHLPDEREPSPDRPSLVELMRDAIGVVDSGIPDLSTNPAHMAGFGRDKIKRSR